MSIAIEVHCWTSDLSLVNYSDTDLAFHVYNSKKASTNQNPAFRHARQKWAELRQDSQWRLRNRPDKLRDSLNELNRLLLMEKMTVSIGVIRYYHSKLWAKIDVHAYNRENFDEKIDALNMHTLSRAVQCLLPQQGY